MNRKNFIRSALMAAVLLSAAGFPLKALSAEALPVEEPAELFTNPTLPELIGYAYEHNPSIQAAREEWKATVESYRVRTAYPDPQLMVTYFPDPIETRFGPQDWNATLSQMIPFPGKLSTAGELVETDAQIARLKLDQAVRNVATDVMISWFELFYINTARQTAARNAGLLDEFRKISETAYAEDRTIFQDVIKAQTQTAQLRYDMILLDELEETEKTRLNGLLNRPPDAPVGAVQQIPVDPVRFSLTELYEMAGRYQEEIRIAGLQTEKAEKEVDLARYENLPDFRVGLFYAGIGEPDVPSPPPDAGDDALGIQFGMEIPVWFGKNRGRMNRARARARKSRAENEAKVNAFQTQIRSVYFRLKNAERLITLYRDELLPQAMEALVISETWFREGEGTFADFLEAQSAAYNFQLALARAKADYGKNLAGLERLVGRPVTINEAGAPAEVTE